MKIWLSIEQKYSNKKRNVPRERNGINMKALISVSDKSGIVEFAKELEKLGIEIISTGGTYKKLKENDVKVTEISDYTGFPECLDGRVKTLHPKVHSGILAMRSNPNHMKQLEELNVDTIDFVVVNLYPFKQTILKESVKREEAIENIDIGGPTMLRSAAKNYQDVTVITDPNDYEKVLTELKENEQVSLDTKFYLMNKVFEHTASYDAMICKYLKEERKDNSLPQELTLTYEKVEEMRYGENPHQIGALYKEIGKCEGSLTIAKQLNGKQLSFNNINDTNGALELLKEFDEPTVVACKHGNPCGVGSDSDIYKAWKKAFEADKTSIFVRIKDFEKSGALFELLRDFKDENINITKIDSRPLYDDKGFKSGFYMDFYGHKDDENVKRIFVKRKDEIKWLGSYPAFE